MAVQLQVGCLLLAAAVVATPTGREGNGYLSCNGGLCVESSHLGEGLARVRSSRTARAANEFITLRLRGHRDVCTPQEVKKAACLNGLCYALELAYMRSAFCECPEKYEGARCEKLSLDFYLVMMSAGAAVKGAIIGGVVFALLIIVVILSVCCYKMKKRRIERKKKCQEEAAQSPSLLQTPQTSGEEPAELTHEDEPLTTDQPNKANEEIEMEVRNSTSSNNIPNGAGPR